MPSAVTDTTYNNSGSAANDYDQHHNDDDEPRANGETQSLLPFAQRATRRFGVTREELVKLVRAKDDDRASEHLQSLGGVEELCKKLHTSSSEGLRIDHEGGEDGYDGRRRRGSFLQFYRRPSLGKRGGALSEQQQSPEAIDRQRVFGKNVLPQPPMVTFWQLLLKTYNDKTLIMLTIAAVISLIINIYDDLWGSKRDDDTKLGWVDGAAILVAVLVVCLTNAINDYNQEKNFRKLNAKKDDRMVRVIRMGRETEIPVADIVVGDILLVECGDVVPVDGIVTSGSRLACDESSLTGESDQVKKGLASEGRDPLIISGSQVTDGGGRMVVIAVGESSSYGRFINMLQSGRGGDDASSDTDDEADAQDSSETPLQRKLDVLVEHITKFGIFSALLMLIVLLVRYLVTYSLNSDSLFPPFDEFIGVMVGIIIQAITIVVIAVPEGLPMAVTIALVYASSRMIKDNNLVRQLAACETMGGVTAVCSDKTGTLTQNRMTVVSGRIADHLLGSASEARQFFAGLPCNVQSLFAESCAINSTAFEDRDPETHRLEFKGSKTECALLTFLKAASPPEGSNTNGDHATDATTAKRADYYRIRKECKKVLTIPFSSKLKSMTTIVDRSIADEGHDAESMPEQGRSGYRAYTKGASEIILSNCSHYLDKSGEVKALDDAVRKDFALAIKESAKQALRTFALAYKDELTQAEYDEVADFSPDRSDSGKAAARPKRDNDNGDDNDTSIELPVKDMVWIGMVGIQDPLREGVVESVRACQRAGIVVRMITGDNIETGKAIAKQAGILTPGSIAIEGKDWRRMSEKEQMAILPRVSVMARSSPEDKLVIVKRLQRLDHIVAMTGDGANDAPALKTADIGFSMGITGTEVAKEASDIVLMDDNFNSIVQALKWGRSISESVRKFLQFQLSVNIAAVTLSFLSALYSERGESILTAVQLLWVNLIMDTLAALALATESPTSKLLERLPIPATADLITYEMWAMIVLQAAFQVVVNLGLVQYGQQMFHIDPNNSANANAKLRTIVFNTFVFLQIFNELNCRRIMPNQFNVLHHLSQDYGFLSIQLIVIALQYLIVTFGGVAFGTVPLSCSEWAITVLIGFLALPVGFIIRCLPNFDRVFGLQSATSDVQQYSPALALDYSGDSFGLTLSPRESSNMASVGDGLSVGRSHTARSRHESPPFEFPVCSRHSVARQTTSRERANLRWRKVYFSIKFASIRKDLPIVRRSIRAKSPT